MLPLDKRAALQRICADALGHAYTEHKRKQQIAQLARNLDALRAGDIAAFLADRNQRITAAHQRPATSDQEDQ